MGLKLYKNIFTLYKYVCIEEPWSKLDFATLRAKLRYFKDSCTEFGDRSTVYEHSLSLWQPTRVCVVEEPGFWIWFFEKSSTHWILLLALVSESLDFVLALLLIYSETSWKMLPSLCFTFSVHRKGLPEPGFEMNWRNA